MKHRGCKILRGRLESRRSPSRFALTVSVVLSLVGCSAPQLARCAAGEEQMMLAQLFFGRNVGAVHGISDAQFGAFVDEVLSRRFPEGMTHLSGFGHWQGSGKLPVREQSDIVTLILPDVPATHANLEGARRDYMARFRQESVMMTYQTVCSRV